MAAQSLPHVELTLLAIRFLILVFNGHKRSPWKTSHFVNSWPSSRVRKSDPDCAIDAQGAPRRGFLGGMRFFVPASFCCQPVNIPFAISPRAVAYFAKRIDQAQSAE